MKTAIAALLSLAAVPIDAGDAPPAPPLAKLTPASAIADYDAEPRRPDGRVDVDLLAARLVELGARTYYWLIWHAPTDWDDLKVFLPKARAAGIEVWVYLVPPSESPPHASTYSEPFRLDFDRWAEEIARLSLDHPNLTAWVIDDFLANREVLTPAAVRGFQARAKKIAPRLAFLPLLYYGELNRRVVEDYREAIEGVVVAYPQDRVEIERARGILDDAWETFPGVISYPWGAPSKAGDFAEVRTEAEVIPDGPRRIRFVETEDFTAGTLGYHWKQLLVDGEVVWEEDVAGGTAGPREVSVDLGDRGKGKAKVTVAFRMLDKSGVGNFGVRWRLADLRADGLQLAADLREPRKWRAEHRGAFETGFGECMREGRRSFHVPFIAMTAGDAGEFRQRHGEPATPERIGAWLRMCLEARSDGLCDGVVTYCLDKSPGSRSFDLSRGLFREFGAKGPAKAER
jgi:hypothetical protein